MACSCSCSRSLDLSKLSLACRMSDSTSLQSLRMNIPLVSNRGRNPPFLLQTSWKPYTIAHNASLWKPRWVVRARDDDYEIEEVMEYEVDKEDEEEENLEDYETDYDVKPSDQDYLESDTFVSTEGEAAEMVVDYKINEEEFHKLSLYHCDFFIRKVPDPDDDVYDFREMYVTAPDTDVYAIPRVEGRMPKKRIRLTKSNYEHICVTEPPVDEPRSPLYKQENQVMKVFLMKHFKNRRTDAWNFVLDFEQIYVIDSKAKSISRAKVLLNVPGGRNRDRSEEILTVRDDGTTFRIIPTSKRKTPDQIIEEHQWAKTKESMDNYLRSFRDYHVSNWF